MSEDTVIIQAIYRRYPVPKRYLNEKMISLIGATNIISSHRIYYAVSQVIDLLPLTGAEITPDLTRGCDDEDTLEAFMQAYEWELPVVYKILKQRILNAPLTGEILRVLREVNDVDYSQLLETYLLQNREDHTIESWIQAYEWEFPNVRHVLKQRITSEPLTRPILKALRGVNDSDYPQLLRKYLQQTVDEDTIYGDMIREYQKLSS